VSIEEQAEVVKEFLEGLLDAFGLAGTVEARVEDEVILVDVVGEQTEALIGPRGTIMQAVHELVRTVVQRKTRQGARIRLDVAGYVQRRREALAIYARRLADQVKEEGQEIMLEPMNAADRKVIHDALTDVEGIRTYSEGEEPNRSVIVAPDTGAEKT
jgi:spoIIIJ-associated protein